MSLHVSLRPVELTDAAAIQRYASDPELAATCNVPHPYPPNEGKRWAEKCVADRIARRRFPSAILAAGDFVGLIGLNTVDFAAGSCEVDYWVARPFWGRGIATNAVKDALELAFGEIGLTRAFSGCRAANPASARVLEKNGFLEIDSVVNDGCFGPKFLHETIRRFMITSEEWHARDRRISSSQRSPSL